MGEHRPLQELWPPLLGEGREREKKRALDYGENLNLLEPFKGIARDELALRREQW
jgi:hypothetical protein